jgi:hypothetical protein
MSVYCVSVSGDVVWQSSHFRCVMTAPPIVAPPGAAVSYRLPPPSGRTVVASPSCNPTASWAS